MANVLLLTHGTGGDLSPFLGLGCALKARGHAVTLLSHCAYAEVAGQAGLNFVALDTPAVFEQFMADGHLLNKLPTIAGFFRRNTLPRVAAEYARIAGSFVPGETLLVARYMSGIAARFAAEKLSIPLVRVFTAPGQATAAAFLADLCQSVLAPEINRSRAELELPPIQDWHAWLRYPRHSIGLWADWFGPPEPTWMPGVTPVGFVWYDDASAQALPAELARLFDRGVRPVLISGGTGKAVDTRFFASSIEACRRLDLPALLITRNRELLPDPLPSNVTWFETWFDRFPSLAGLMKRMALVLHHGGMGTLGQALAAGAPQLVLAGGGDRPDNAERLHALGVAEFLRPPQWEAGPVSAALHRLLDDAPAVQARCAEVAGWMRRADPTAAACDLIEDVIERGECIADVVPGLRAAPGDGERAARQDAGLAANLMALSPEKRAILAARLKGRG